jgi:hypothetical protein
LFFALLRLASRAAAGKTAREDALFKKEPILQGGPAVVNVPLPVA